MPVPTTHRLYAADPGAFAASIESAADSRPVLSAPGVIFWVHSSPFGARITDLYDAEESAVSVVTSDDRGFVPFYALNGQGTLWMQPTVSGVGTGVFTPVFPAGVADDAQQALADAAAASALAGTALQESDLPSIAATAQAQTDSGFSALRGALHPFGQYPLLANQVNNVVFHVAGRIPGTTTQVPFPTAAEMADGKIHIIFSLG